MHEFSLAKSILETVLSVAKEHHANKVLKVDLEMGELTFLKPEQLEFAFKIVSEGTMAENATLKIVVIPAKIRCPKCNFEGRVSYNGPEIHDVDVILFFHCPKCNYENAEIVGGTDCTVKNVELRVEESKG